MPKNINKEPGGRSTPPCPACRGSGLVMLFTSARPCEDSGTIVSQVALVYNDFAQLESEPQSHSGAVTGSTPAVGYIYDTGDFGSNEIRLTGLIYPNGRPIGYSFGVPGGMNDLLNRVESIQDNSSGATDLATYTYIGAGTVVRIAYPQPQIWLDLWGGVSGQFQGLDQFNRIIDQRWQSYATSPPVDVDRYQYGYDPNSNPIWKANIVGTPNVAGGLDELYSNDNLNRLTKMQRGVLNAARTALTATPARQMTYGLEATGNWGTYLTQTTGTTDLDQGRVSNPVNEITNITASGGTPVWVTPVYDGAGNMTTMPQPGTPTSAFTAVYDAWNRMTKLSAGGSSVGQYQHDGRNFRIVTLTTETRHFYFTNNWQDIEQRVGTESTIYQQNVWGVRYVDDLVCRDDATPQRMFATQDRIFSVTGLFSASGSALQRFVYDPYGNSAVLTAGWAPTTDSFTWGTRFTGQRFDAESDIYLYRERYYHPGLGGFLCRDQLFPSVEIDSYAYVLDNPLIAVDPYGRSRLLIGTKDIDCNTVAPNGNGRSMLSNAVAACRTNGGQIVASVRCWTETYQIDNGVEVLFKRDETCMPFPTPKSDAQAECPGPGWTWAGPVVQGSWVYGKRFHIIHPDLTHPAPIGAHWDYTDPVGDKWRVYVGTMPPGVFGPPAPGAPPAFIPK